MNFAEYLDSLGLFGIKLGLEQTRELAHLAGDPDRGMRFLHIAGSNGKGSCGAMLERALRECGFRTGFYSSPHLSKPGERFRIDGRALTDAEMEESGVPLIALCEAMRSEGRCPTFFELTTVLALCVFAAHKVDFAVWETGMGGRFDATNIVNPELSIITNITLEHTQYLGDTIEKIAFEKAGIVKPGRPVFCGPMSAEALEVIRNAAEARGAAFHTPGAIRFDGYCPWRGVLRQRLWYGAREFALSLPGAMQRDNCATVVPALEFLSGKFGFDFDRALSGLGKTCWPGRCQLLNARTVVDGGHNPDGMAKLVSTLREIYPGEKFRFVFGSFADKDTEKVLRAALPEAAEFVFTPLRAEARACRTPEELAAMLGRLAPGMPCRIAKNLAQALALADKPDYRTVVTGSLYLVGEALELLGEAACLEQL